MSDDKPNDNEYEVYRQETSKKVEKRLTYLQENPRTTGVIVVAALVLFGFAVQAMEAMTFATWGTFIVFAIIVAVAVWLLIR